VFQRRNPEQGFQAGLEAAFEGGQSIKFKDRRLGPRTLYVYAIRLSGWIEVAAIEACGRVADIERVFVCNFQNDTNPMHTTHSPLYNQP
jgi:hypothetical protein